MGLFSGSKVQQPKKSLGATILEYCWIFLAVGLGAAAYFHFVAGVPAKADLTAVEFVPTKLTKHHRRKGSDYYQIDAKVGDQDHAYYIENIAVSDADMKSIPATALTALVATNDYIYDLKAGEHPILMYETAREKVGGFDRLMTFAGLVAAAAGALGLGIGFLVNKLRGVAPSSV